MKDSLSEIFLSVKKLLEPYGSKIKVTRDSTTGYELTSAKRVVIDKRELNGIFFASAMIKKNFVGFYFFPIYTHPKEFAGIPPELKKCLKGKSCFHLTKLDPQLNKQIEALLKQGFEFYKSLGWID